MDTRPPPRPLALPLLHHTTRLQPPPFALHPAPVHQSYQHHNDHQHPHPQSPPPAAAFHHRAPLQQSPTSHILPAAVHGANSSQEPARLHAGESSPPCTSSLLVISTLSLDDLVVAVSVLEATRLPLWTTLCNMAALLVSAEDSVMGKEPWAQTRFPFSLRACPARQKLLLANVWGFPSS